MFLGILLDLIPAFKLHNLKSLDLHETFINDAPFFREIRFLLYIFLLIQSVCTLWHKLLTKAQLIKISQLLYHMSVHNHLNEAELYIPVLSISTVLTIQRAIKESTQTVKKPPCTLRRLPEQIHHIPSLFKSEFAARPTAAWSTAEFLYIQHRSRISTNAIISRKNSRQPSGTWCPWTEAVSRSSPRCYRLPTHVTIWKVERIPVPPLRLLYYQRRTLRSVSVASDTKAIGTLVSCLHVFPRCPLRLVLNGGLTIFSPGPLEIIVRSGTTGELGSFVSESLLRPRNDLRRRGSWRNQNPTGKEAFRTVNRLEDSCTGGARDGEDRIYCFIGSCFAIFFCSIVVGNFTLRVKKNTENISLSFAIVSRRKILQSQSSVWK